MGDSSLRSKTLLVFLCSHLSVTRRQSKVRSFETGAGYELLDGCLVAEFHGPVRTLPGHTFVKTTPQKTRFRDVKICKNFEIQIELTMTGQSRTTTSRRKNFVLGIAYAW